MKLEFLPAILVLLRFSLAVGESITLSLSDLLSMPGGDVDDDPSTLPSMGGGAKIPGDNPLYLCVDEQYEDTCQIDEIDLVPNPPQRGRELLTNASGELAATIDKGSFVHVQVKLAGTRILNRKYDLCAGLKRFGQQCPFEAGYISVSKEMKIDKMVPRGKYFAHVRVASAENEQITCFAGVFKF